MGWKVSLEEYFGHNMRLGSLTVLSDAGVGQTGGDTKRRLVNCLCDCGKHFTAIATRVKSGRKLSCGCALTNPLTKHLGCKSPEYKSWESMKQRCLNPNHHAYADYGGRGIKVCASWESDYGQFVKDMGPRPTLSHTLDRINNDGDYEPSNCQWATRKQQQNNRRDNRRLEIGGEIVLLGPFCEAQGLSRKTVYQRIDNGKPFSELFKPSRRSA